MLCVSEALNLKDLLSFPENAFPQKSCFSFYYIFCESIHCSVMTYSLRPYGL